MPQLLLFRSPPSFIGKANIASCSRSEFDQLRDWIVTQTRAEYCRPVGEVEQEIAGRQAALMEETERAQGRREEVEASKQDGQGQPFRPSRRHKEPPKN